MSSKKSSKFGRFRALVAGFLVLIGLFTGINSVFLSDFNAYAVEENVQTVENSQTDGGQNNQTNADSGDKKKNGCKDSLGALGWLVCPVTEKIAEAVDFLYDKIRDILEIKPISAEDGTPIYEIWKYCLGVTNIVFIIFLLIVIYSQLTGLGISNYGIKKSLPKLIVVAIIVNLSFLICALAVDLSNVIGNGLRGLFDSVEEAAFANGMVAEGSGISYSGLYSSLAGGAALTIGGAAIAVEFGLIWMLIPTVLGAIVAVVTGLITIALRQAIVILLVMISPLAMVAYILPNTEKWFQKWKELFIRMLIFYPVFSLLFGASSLAGFAIIMSASSGFGIILGMAVQIFPLFFSWKLMQMSGTMLGNINSKMRGMAANPLERNKDWATSHRNQTRAKTLRDGMTPSSRLMRYLDYRKALREKNTETMGSEYKNIVANKVYDRFSSYNGRDANGNDRFRKRPSKYTVNAKRASRAELRASTASSRLENAVSAYGNTFSKDKKAQKLGNSTGEAFKDYAMQEFLKANNAQADEDFLFGAYTKAMNDRFVDPTQYNRLIKNAAGDLGAKGTSTVMGQVIQKNAKTETQRRAEAFIMINKFGYDRASFHSAATGVLRNADGYAIDREGNVIEDSMFRLLPGKQYVKWDKYEYDTVTGKNIAYFDMFDDNGKPVQRVYMNDNGYMKELLTDDIMIGDPVNRLYEMSAGLGDAHTENGPLRKYYSTIAKNITSWKDHSGGSTPMLAAMIRNGTINSEGKFTIGYLQSLKAVTKASAFLTNDKFIINDLNKLFVAANPELFMTGDGKISELAAEFTDLKSGDDWVPFEYYISDQDIEDYLDVKKTQLSGMRLDENTGNWQKIAFNDPTITTEDKKNMIMHDLIPGTIKKLFSLTNRKLSPNILENQKPPTAEALSNMLEIFNVIGQSDPSIYDTTDPDMLRRCAEEAKRTAEALRDASRDNHEVTLGQTEESVDVGRFATLRERIERGARNRSYREQQNSPQSHMNTLRDIVYGDYNLDDLCAVLQDFADNSEIDPTIKAQINDIINENRYSERAESSADAAYNMTHFYEEEAERKEKIKRKIEDLLGGF